MHKQTHDLGVNKSKRYVVGITAGSFLIVAILAILFKLIPRPINVVLEILSIAFIGAVVVLGSLCVYIRNILAKYVVSNLELFNQAAKFEKLVRNIPGMAFQLRRSADGEYSVPFATNGIVDTFGLRPEEVSDLFSPIGDLILREDIPSLVRSIEYSARHLSLLQCEFRIEMKDGSVKSLLVQAMPERLSVSCAVLWHGHISDITKYRMLFDERMKLQRLESIGVLAGGIAHDFNNILAAISGNASLISVLATNDKTKLASGYIEKAVERATGLTRQLLAFAKGGIPTLEKTALPRLVKDSVGLFLGESSSSKVVVSFPDNLWRVNVDKIQLAQVLQNLIINAHQAMPLGGLITIGAENVKNPHGISLEGSYVKLSIGDTGVGIPEDFLPRIFEPYFTTKGANAGTGLGLALTYRVIEKHKGKITVTSQVDVGTTFVLYLPAAEDAVDDDGHDAQKLRSFNGLRVLAMDDDPMVQAALSGMLKLLHCNSVITDNGGDTVFEYSAPSNSSDPFEVVILDLTIPGGIGGEEVLRILKEKNPNLRAIISSGYSDRVPVGFRAALPKPYTIEDLSNALDRALADPGHVL